MALEGARQSLLATTSQGMFVILLNLFISWHQGKRPAKFPDKFGISSEPAGPSHSKRHGLHQSFANLLGSVLSIREEFSGANKDWYTNKKYWIIKPKTRWNSQKFTATHVFRCRPTHPWLSWRLQMRIHSIGFKCKILGELEVNPVENKKNTSHGDLKIVFLF